MNVKKKRAMEEKHIKMTPRGSKKPKDNRKDMTLEEMQELLKPEEKLAAGFWWAMPKPDIHDPYTRSTYEALFKNVEEIYQLAIKLEQSPLMKALE